MADERGERPFAVLADREGLADFDHINPAYFQSLDRKLRYLSEQGFVGMLEPVRRDACPAWKAYFDFNTSYARYVQYLVSRYGAFTLIFSPAPKNSWQLSPSRSLPSTRAPRQYVKA